MCNFIEDYLNDPSTAIKTARKQLESKEDLVDESQIYNELQSPEFKLYCEIVLNDLPLQRSLKQYQSVSKKKEISFRSGSGIS